MDTALFVSCRQKRLTRRLQDQTTSVRQRDTAPLCCHQKHIRKAAKKWRDRKRPVRKHSVKVLRITACVPHLHTGCAPIRNLPWRRPAGPSWPLEADRKVAPHGQLLARRKYGYGLKAKTSIIQPNVHLSMARKNVWHDVT